MRYLRSGLQTLFGQTPVEIFGAFDFDETVERFNIILSKRFFSEHLRHTVIGGQDKDGKIEFLYGYHDGKFGDRFGRLGVSARRMPLPTPRLVGDLAIEDGLAVYRGQVEISQADRIASVILLAVILIGAMSLFGLARSPSAVSTALMAGIVVPAGALYGLEAVLRHRGQKLTEMLHWVMTEPHE